VFARVSEIVTGFFIHLNFVIASCLFQSLITFQENMNDQLILSEKFIKIARKELGEDEKTKQEGLEQLRAWIKSHPNIKKCCQGMVKKYNFSID
jgi:hypothetical protein